MRIDALRIRETNFANEHVEPDYLLGGFCSGANILSASKACPLRRLHEILDIPLKSRLETANLNAQPLN